MSELSSDVRTHSYLNPQTASDTTRTNGLSCYDENHSTTGSFHESVDLLATLDCSRHLFFSQGMSNISLEGLRSVVGYVRYHFPSFNLAVISFEDPLRVDGWVHSSLFGLFRLPCKTVGYAIERPRPLRASKGKRT